MTNDKPARANNRRSQLMHAAVLLFIERGFEGTSVADLVQAVGMSKAAFGYHFESKDALLVELASPLLNDLVELEAVAARDETFIAKYMDTLMRHSDLVAWIDGDRSVLSHPQVGERLSDHLSRMRKAWSDGTEEGEVKASIALAALWRPIRNLDDQQITNTTDTIVGTVGAILTQST